MTLPSGTWRQGEAVGATLGTQAESSQEADDALNQHRGQVKRSGLGDDELRSDLSVSISSQMRTNAGIPKGLLCSDILASALCTPRGKMTYFFFFCFSFLICFILSSRDPSQQRVKKWGFSLEEALKDPAGRDQFLKFLESEFSSENLR